MKVHLQYSYMLFILNMDEIMKPENKKDDRSPSGKAVAFFDFT